MADGDIVWQADTGYTGYDSNGNRTNEYGSLLVTPDSVVVVHDDPDVTEVYIERRDKADGSLTNKTTIPGRTLAAPNSVTATNSGDLLIPVEGDTLELICITPDGSELWRSAGNYRYAAAAYDDSNHRVYSLDWNGDVDVVALDAGTGDKIWRTTVDDTGISGSTEDVQRISFNRLC